MGGGGTVKEGSKFKYEKVNNFNMMLVDEDQKNLVLQPLCNILLTMRHPETPILYLSVTLV